MAKRWIDTSLDSQEWFQALPAYMRNLWCFMYRRCNQFGFWTYDFPAASKSIGHPVKRQDINSYFPDQAKCFNTFCFLFNFIIEQYGFLTPEAPLHVSIIQQLRIIGVDPVSYMRPGLSASLSNLRDLLSGSKLSDILPDNSIFDLARKFGPKPAAAILKSAVSRFDRSMATMPPRLVLEWFQRGVATEGRGEFGYLLPQNQ